MPISQAFARTQPCAFCLAALLFLVSTCWTQERPSNSKTKQADLVGEWGGLHLAMSVTAKGAILEFDCAHGEIDKPMRPDARSRFAVRGTFVQEHGGPVRSGEVPNSEEALYTGTLSGNQMTIAVRLLAPNQQIGTFVLTRGEPARLVKCK
jgi:hypothetical protein